MNRTPTDVSFIPLNSLKQYVCVWQYQLENPGKIINTLLNYHNFLNDSEACFALLMWLLVCKTYTMYDIPLFKYRMYPVPLVFTIHSIIYTREESLLNFSPLPHFIFIPVVQKEFHWWFCWNSALKEIIFLMLLPLLITLMKFYH